MTTEGIHTEYPAHKFTDCSSSYATRHRYTAQLFIDCSEASCKVSTLRWKKVYAIETVSHEKMFVYVYHSLLYSEKFNTNSYLLSFWKHKHEQAGTWHAKRSARMYSVQVDNL